MSTYHRPPPRPRGPARTTGATATPSARRFTGLTPPGNRSRAVGEPPCEGEAVGDPPRLHVRASCRRRVVLQFPRLALAFPPLPFTPAATARRGSAKPD